MSRRRIAVVLVVSLALSACSSGGPVMPAGAGQAVSPLATSPPASEPLPPDGRNSLPARTLAALAIERVTGRATDPARLAALMR